MLTFASYDLVVKADTYRSQILSFDDMLSEEGPRALVSLRYKVAVILPTIPRRARDPPGPHREMLEICQKLEDECKKFDSLPAERNQGPPWWPHVTNRWKDIQPSGVFNDTLTLLRPDMAIYARRFVQETCQDMMEQCRLLGLQPFKALFLASRDFDELRTPYERSQAVEGAALYIELRLANHLLPGYQPRALRHQDSVETQLRQQMRDCPRTFLAYVTPFDRFFEGFENENEAISKLVALRHLVCRVVQDLPIRAGERTEGLNLARTIATDLIAKEEDYIVQSTSRKPARVPSQLKRPFLNTWKSTRSLNAHQNLATLTLRPDLAQELHRYINEACWAMLSAAESLAYVDMALWLAAQDFQALTTVYERCRAVEVTHQWYEKHVAQNPHHAQAS